MVGILIWALSYVPRPAAPLPGQAPMLASQQLEHSALGIMGKALEPAFKPLGWDYRITMAAIASFPAREVVVGTLGTIFNLSSDSSAEGMRLSQKLKEAKWPDGRPLFGLAVALSIMVFFALCMQCASTLSVIKKESGHWKWAALAFGYMTVLAYLAAWATFALASRFISGA
jgi:ferrous iron transport protein B